jgi:catechol 2,3-dioxygenase-like lactoylglutathione lyase family enzyme
MRMKRSIPALPVFNIDRAVQFYQEKLGFISGYHDKGFAKLTRDDVELHLWAACDKAWKFRSIILFLKPIWSGAESFLAGTSSCRIEIEKIDDLFNEYKGKGVLYSPETKVEETSWRTREFPALDLHRNLLTFYEPTPNAGKGN